ncbi:MAG: hypothetical protein M3P08_09235 [Thermoproteota archaeon]|nr:hypothetical protein [Thermoproteota archaeon]
MHQQSIVRLLFFYGIGGAAIIISLISVAMDQMHMLNFSVNDRVVLYLSLAAWLGMYGYIGLIVGDGKPKHIVLSMVLAWYSDCHLADPKSLKS